MKRRWWLPAVIVAVGFIGSLLPVSAQAPSGARPGVTYVGKANVGTDVSIAVSANGSKVERLGFGPAPLTECQTGNEIRDLALDTDGFGVSNLPLLQGFNMWSVHGFFGEAGAAVGGYRQEQTSLFGPNDPALPFVCVLPQYGVFVASDPVSADAIGGGVVPGGRYEGFSQPIHGRSIADLDEVLPTLGSDALVRETYEILCGEALAGRRLAQWVPLDYPRGQLALRLGLPLEEAEQHFRTGLEWCERERCPVEAGRCHQGLAEVAERRDDLGAAREHLDAAGALFAQHGAKLYLDQVLAKKEFLKA